MEKLTVTVLEAKDLVPKDETTGASDPYVLLYAGKRKFRSKTVHGTVNPTFGESFTFELHAFEPLYVEVFDSDRVSADDFEGCCSVNWWEDADLNRTGASRKSFKLGPGVGEGRQGKAGGELALDIRLPEFAERLQQQGHLRAIFGDIPETERVQSSSKCSFGKVAAGQAPATVATSPGYVFLLDNYVFAYAVTRDQPLQARFSFEEIRTADKAAKPPNSLVVGLAGDTHFLFSGIPDLHAFHTRLHAAMTRCYASQALRDAPARSSALPSIGGGSDDGPVTEENAKAIAFKVFIPEHRALKCNPFYFVSSRTNMTFKSLAERVFQIASVSGIPVEKYRFFPALPAIRTPDMQQEKLTSTKTIGSLLKSRLVSYGCALILRSFTREASKMPSFKKAEVPISVTVLIHRDTASEPAVMDISVLPRRPLKESVLDLACSHNGLDPKRAFLFLVSLSADTSDVNAHIPIDPSRCPADYHLVEGDTLAVKLLAPFSSSTKFAQASASDAAAAFLFAAHCEHEPVTVRPAAAATVLPALGKALGIGPQQCDELEAVAKDHATWGAQSLLLELDGRARAAASDPHYTRESFSDEASFVEWLKEELALVSATMRNIVFERFQFCAELHVTLEKANNLLAADLTGLSDPYCVVLYKGQRKTTKTLKKTLNPEWRETLHFSFTSMDSPIGITCFDWDRFSKPENLGSTSINIRESPNLLDGERHELTLKLNTKGTVVVSVQLFSEFGHYLRPPAPPKEALSQTPSPTPTSAPAPAATPPTPTPPATPAAPKVDVTAAFNMMFSALGAAKEGEERPWILDEFSARFPVSQAYGSILQLQTLILQEHKVTPEYARATSGQVIALIRPTSKLNLPEEQMSKSLLKQFWELCQSELLGVCFSTAEGAISVTEPLMKALLELKEEVPDIGDLNALVLSSIKTGAAATFARLMKGVSWDNCEDAASTVAAILRAEHPAAFAKLETLIKATVPAAIAKQASDTVIDQMIQALQGDVASLCGAISKASTQQQGAIFEVLKALNSLEDLSKEKAGKRLSLSSYSGLLLLWVRKSKEMLLEWIDRAIKVDKRKPVKVQLSFLLIPGWR